MVSNSKVIYLQKEDGRSIKAYVVSFLQDQTTNKIYVIVANQNGKNVKGYEVVENEAVILSVEESSIFKGYKNNPNFVDVTNEFEDGMHLELVKEAKKEETVDVVYYVFDNHTLNAYKASLSTSNVLSKIHFLKVWENIEEEDIARIVNENQYPEPAFVVYDKENDLEYGDNGTVIPLRWTAVSDIPFESSPDIYDLSIEEHLETSNDVNDDIERLETPEENNYNEAEIETNEVESIPTEENLEEGMDTSFVEEEQEGKKEAEEIEVVIEGEPIIFYVYDENVVKKYSALSTNQTEDTIEVKDVKTIEVMTGAENLDVNRFLASKDIEIGAYFVNYDNYNPTIENVSGKLIASATLKNALCKTKEMEEQYLEEEPPVETAEKEETPTKILVFNGDIDVYDNQTHYTIWGCFCTVVNENPLTVIPDKNGVKTIIYEDEKSSSMEEVCQNYQNLYPNISVYLTNAEIKGNEAIVIEEYTVFKPQEENKEKTLLESGKKILTEDEMIAKRQEELERLKNQATN